MELQNGTARTRLVSTIIAVVLALIAIRSVRRGNRLRGLLAGAGALGAGYAAATRTGSDAAEIEVEDDRRSTPATDEATLRCAACGDAIRTGQRRRPNENYETVHESCAD